MAKHEVTREVTREVTKPHDPFQTTVTDAPDFKEEEEHVLSQKTLGEQAAGREALASYVPPPPEEKPEEPEPEPKHR